MLNDVNNLILITASKILQELEMIKQAVDILEVKANKLATILGFDIVFSPWSVNEIVSTYNEIIFKLEQKLMQIQKLEQLFF